MKDTDSYLDTNDLQSHPDASRLKLEIQNVNCDSVDIDVKPDMLNYNQIHKFQNVKSNKE